MKFFRFKNWPMFNKILVVGLSVSFLFLGSIFFLLLPKVELFTIDSKKQSLRNMTEVAYSFVDIQVKRFHAGEISEKEAKETARTLVKELSYDGDNYFWINDLDCTMIMHPKKPSLDGKSVKNTTDPEGKYMFQEMVKTVRVDGQGEVFYMWPKPGEDEPIPKMSSVILHKEWGWVIGTGVYIEDLNLMIAALKGLTLKIVALCFALAIGLSVWIGHIIVKPIRSSVTFASNVAVGDLSIDLEVHQNDEIGKLGDELNHMISNLRLMFSEISEGIDLLKDSSNKFATISHQFSSNAQQSGGKASEVATKAEQMSQNIRNISNSSDETMEKIRSIVAAIEEMNVTFNEISKHTENARMVVERAVDQGRSASGRVDLLGKAAQSISQVTEVITAISEQTNLLALNATIEAASAGEAGKGFAVVANEIKDLAHQTAKATNEISGKILEIQTMTGETVTDMKKVSEVINEVSSYVTSIAGSIEEQAAVTGEIAQNVSVASTSLDAVNSQVQQSHLVSESVAGDMAFVGEASSEVIIGCGDIESSVSSLTELALNLESTTKRFKLGARDAKLMDVRF